MLVFASWRRSTTFIARRSPGTLPAGKTRPVITEAQIDEAVALYRDGWTLHDVGQHVGVADQTIRRVLVERSVTIRPGGRKKVAVVTGWATTRFASERVFECDPSRSHRRRRRGRAVRRRPEVDRVVDARGFGGRA